MTGQIEINPCAAVEMRALFGLAKSAFEAVEGWSDRGVLDTLEHDTLFVARDEGQLAGYVALRRETDEAFVVEQLFVAPGHERRGIGHRLLAHAEGYAIAEHARRLRIVVEEDNEPARSFYRRSGFVPVAAEVFELVLPVSE